MRPHAVRILATRWLVPALVSLSVSITAGAADSPLRFNRDIRPILSENCFHCHGPDEQAREAGLRLDTEEGAKEYVVVPGSLEESELIARIESDDPDLLMPPRHSERMLTPEQIKLLKQWVREGASYEGHWAFATPQKQPLPQSGQDGDDGPTGDRHPIDRFIDAALEQQGLRATGPADRETLIRRATFDLVGLPPTLAEIDAFVADDSPDAYERLLDRLLSRHQYGERMASDWLDAARYSDTYGYQVDRDRFVWPWRDWVIEAFNRNLPYDQFITEQLAGDLLPNASDEQILATTFNRLHPQKVEGGSVPEEFRVEYVADRTQTVATAVMGLTYECCRCHTHKYDPFTQQEYYQLSAYFDNIDEAGLYSFFTSSVPTPTLALPTDQQRRALKQSHDKIAELERKINDLMERRNKKAGEHTKQGAASDEELMASIASPIAKLEFEEPPGGENRLTKGVVGNAVRLSGDDAVKTDVGNFNRWQPFSVSLWLQTPDKKERAVVFHRSRAWTDAGSRGYQLLIEDGKLSWSLIHFWPGNAIRIRTSEALEVGRWTHVAVTYDGSSRAEGLRIFVDGKRASCETVRDSLTRQITGGGGDHIAIGERFRDRGFTGGLVDRFRVFDQQLTPLEIKRLSVAEETLDIASLDPALRREHRLLRTDAEIASVLDELQKARQQKSQVQDAIEEIMVMKEMSPPRTTYLLNRGAYDQRADEVAPGTPAALPPLPSDAQPNRLGLARWLTDPRHPLTSRVAVNRLWQLCFGTGLVSTPEDFGSQGSPPSHPELLDWMAVDFVQHNWDIKRMLKQIMMTATYRRSSRPADPRVVEKDPDNRYLARFPRYRMPAEMLRDNALAISGRLVTTVGGPPVRPYELEASFKPSQADKGPGLYRRSLYTYWKRTSPAPAMMTFDAAKRDVCRVRREKTSSPLQAFVMLNGPQYVEAARGLAENLSRQLGDRPEDANEVIQRAFRLLTGRPPEPDENEVLQELYKAQLDYFDQHPKRRQDYLNVGHAKADASLDPTHLAAMSMVVNTLMNFDQSMMKR